MCIRNPQDSASRAAGPARRPKPRHWLAAPDEPRNNVGPASIAKPAKPAERAPRLAKTGKPPIKPRQAKPLGRDFFSLLLFRRRGSRVRVCARFAGFAGYSRFCWGDSEGEKGKVGTCWSLFVFLFFFLAFFVVFLLFFYVCALCARGICAVLLVHKTHIHSTSASFRSRSELDLGLGLVRVAWRSRSRLALPAAQSSRRLSALRLLVCFPPSAPPSATVRCPLS